MNRYTYEQRETINRLMRIAGCDYDVARMALIDNDWNYLMALEDIRDATTE